jgi:hypothetical protein
MPPYNRYNPRDWYWIAKDGRIYSSARNRLVHIDDTGYRAFLATNGAASPWPVDINGKQTTAALQDVLTPYGIKLTFS